MVCAHLSISSGVALFLVLAGTGTVVGADMAGAGTVERRDGPVAGP